MIVAKSFRYRAECEADVVCLDGMLRKFLGFVEHRYEHLKFPSGTDQPDCQGWVEFSQPISLDSIRQAMARIEDGHVMYQTVQPTGDYTGERDYELQFDREGHLIGNKADPVYQKQLDTLLLRILEAEQRTKDKSN
jgi:hypothetical protein